MNNEPGGTIYPATPYRNKASRADGLLKQGKTRIAEMHRRYEQYDRDR